MKTLIVDVTNEKALRLLEDLESLELIRLRKYPHHQRHISSAYYDLKEDKLKKSKADNDQILETLRRDWE
jgi:hypothetical protein